MGGRRDTIDFYDFYFDLLSGLGHGGWIPCANVIENDQKSTPTVHRLQSSEVGGMSSACLLHEAGGSISAFDLQQHLRVVGELLEEEQQTLHRLSRAVAGEAAADEVNLVQHVVGQE